MINIKRMMQSTCLLIVATTMALITSCSNASLPVHISIKKEVNSTPPYGTLPLDLIIYGLNKKNLLETADFYLFWEKIGSRLAPGVTPLKTLHLTPGRPYQQQLLIPKGNRFIGIYARFHNPEYKTWHRIIEVPKDIHWRGQTLVVSIDHLGLHVRIIKKQWQMM